MGSLPIQLFRYDAQNLTEQSLDASQVVPELVDPKQVTWINIDGVEPRADIQTLCERFGVHPLAIDDLFNLRHRPKLEEYDDYLFLVTKMLSYNEASHSIKIEQVGLILKDHCLISIQQDAEHDLFEPLRERLRSGRCRARKYGADFLMYELLDAIVDQYFVILEKMGEGIGDLEDQLVTNPRTLSLKELHHLKRELIYLRKAVWPMREVVSALCRDPLKQIRRPTVTFFRDIYDHIIYVIDTLETDREMLSGMIELYLSSLSLKMNEVMKVLTIITTLFMPLTFIAGVYGMNFEFMPEVRWKYGYPMALGLMAVSAIGLIGYFRKRRWL